MRTRTTRPCSPTSRRRTPGPRQVDRHAWTNCARRSSTTSRPDEADRPQRARVRPPPGPGRVLVLRPHHRGSRLSQLPPLPRGRPGLPARSRTSACRRERSCCSMCRPSPRARTSSPSGVSRSRPDGRRAGLLGRHRRRRAVPPALPRPDHGRAPPRRRGRGRRRRLLGRGPGVLLPDRRRRLATRPLWRHRLGEPAPTNCCTPSPTSGTGSAWTAPATTAGCSSLPPARPAPRSGCWTPRPGRRTALGRPTPRGRRVRRRDRRRPAVHRPQRRRARLRTRRGPTGGHLTRRVARRCGRRARRPAAGCDRLRPGPGAEPASRRPAGGRPAAIGTRPGTSAPKCRSRSTSRSTTWTPTTATRPTPTGSACTTSRWSPRTR